MAVVVRQSLLLMCIGALCCCKVASGNGVFRLEISSYSRSTQKNANVHRDTCCDEATGMCRPTCQLCMTIDVNAHMKGNSTRLQRTIATTPLTLDQYRRHKIQFLKTQYVSLESSETLWSMKVRLFRHYNKTQGCQGFVEELELQSNPDAVIGKYSAKGRSLQVVVDSSFQCATNWYGKECTTHCIHSSNDITGHYTCDPATGRKVCLLNYHGDTCSRYCKEQNDVRGHFRCSKDGERVCRKGWIESKEGCVKHESPTQCHHDTRWIKLMTSDVESTADVWKSLKSIICKTINKNCFGRDACPKTNVAGSGLLTLKELLIYNATLHGTDITLRMKINAKNRCIDISESCFNFDLLPSDERIKLMISFINPIVVPPRPNTHLTKKRNHMVLYSLLGLLFLVLFMLLLDKLLKPKEVTATIMAMLTPNVIKRTRL